MILGKEIGEGIGRQQSPPGIVGDAAFKIKDANG
jgi:hypothetical protein